MEFNSPRICSNHTYCADPKYACFENNKCFLPSGKGLIGGTKWIVGYNTATLSKEQIEKAKQMVKKQLELAGEHYDEAVFGRYQFVLGIAANTETIIGEEGWRVFCDNFTNGHHSAETQGLYDSLKERSFTELDCHSNGGMVCLAALENKDVRAEHVVLFGPQITESSLLKWDVLKSSGVVKSVKIYINRNDPVPGFTMLYVNDPQRAQELANKAMLTRDVLGNTIRVISPNIDVRMLDCTGLSNDPLECHYLKAYEASTNGQK
jgi:hypothetical protein